MFKVIDEGDVVAGDVLVMFETGPWGLARVMEIGKSDVHGYRLAKLRRPFLYDDSGEPGVENYSIFLHEGRPLKRFER